MRPELDEVLSLDHAVAQAAKRIRILAQMSWPKAEQDRFVDAYARGVAYLPQIDYAPVDLDVAERALARIVERADPAEPLGDYVKKTAHSYYIATQMLKTRGTAQMTANSIALYGRPGDAIAGQELTNLDAARHFIQVADEYAQEISLHEAEYCIPAEVVRDTLVQRLNDVFTAHPIEVEIDPDLVAKAAAGPTRIRIRGATCFSEYDINQLIEHEAFVHTLTSLNGRAQKALPTLGMGSPRTTGTQEGLAVFAELITGSIDIIRMKRISLRIQAIDLALKGANFIEVYTFFCDHGATETESFNSAMRVYRGAPTDGGHAFTKDAVYLHGLLSVHTFFRWALKNHKLKLCRALFAGRMTLQDVLNLEPLFDEGVLTEPLYLPPWMHKGNGLAGYLSFSVFANKIRLDSVERDELTVAH
jgi:uncharacterized protein (TIGR02421 family)